MTPAGRPPRSSLSSTKSVSTRCTNEEWHAWKKASGHMYLSDWIREKCNDAVGIARPPMVRVPESVNAETMHQLFEMSRALGERIAAGVEPTIEIVSSMNAMIESLVGLVRIQEQERVNLQEQLVLIEALAKMQERFASANAKPEDPEPLPE